MKNTLLYWVPTVALLFFMVGSGIYYFVDTPEVAKEFELLGYPTYSLYFNAIAKFIGGIALVAPVGKVLKEWAYAGYIFIILLATQAHFVTGTPERWFMLVFITIWVLSYWAFKKLR